MTSKIVISYNNFEKIAAKFAREVGIEVAKTAKDVNKYAKTFMSSPKSGRIYMRGRRKHVASAPGESPAVDTGNLKNSLFEEKTGQTSAIAGVGAEYGIHLEFGTTHIAPRPFMRPAAIKAAERYFAALRRLEKRLT